MLLSVLNIVFFIAFIWFARVNMNDKDAWLWVSIYLIAAVLCGLAAFKYYYPLLYIPVVSFYLLYAIILFFVKDGVLDWITKYKAQNIAATMQATKPYIEKTREFFGLLIITGALLINLWLSYRVH
ncbi:MAG TPA: transmembrane 220 family protein [Agriterribacter sp.]|nr:transmembrane 220 family protein [Agriterribacter sp.]HRQ50288.1 transmembrane 220 family protein [Agriterribacter sp.]